MRHKHRLSNCVLLFIFQECTVGYLSYSAMLMRKYTNKIYTSFIPLKESFTPQMTIVYQFLTLCYTEFAKTTWVSCMPPRRWKNPGGHESCWCTTASIGSLFVLLCDLAESNTKTPKSHIYTKKLESFTQCSTDLCQVKPVSLRGHRILALGQ